MDHVEIKLTSRVWLLGNITSTALLKLSSKFWARNKSRYGEAVTADSTVPDSMDDSDHTPLCILRTHHKAIRLSRHMDSRPKMSMYYEDDIALPDEFAFARSARDHYLQQEFPQNHQSQHSNKAPVRLGKKNNRTDFEDVKLLSSLLPHITNITRISTPTTHLSQLHSTCRPTGHIHRPAYRHSPGSLVLGYGEGAMGGYRVQKHKTGQPLQQSQQAWQALCQQGVGKAITLHRHGDWQEGARWEGKTSLHHQTTHSTHTDIERLLLLSTFLFSQKVQEMLSRANRMVWINI